MDDKLIIGLLITNSIALLAFIGRTIWFMSKLDSRVCDAEKDINGFGGRVGSVEKENAALNVRVSVIEAKGKNEREIFQP